MHKYKNHKEWNLSDVKFIQENIHLTDDELALVLETTRCSVQAFRLRFGIKRKKHLFTKGNMPKHKGAHLKNFGNRFTPTNIPQGARPLNQVFTETDSRGIKYKFIKLAENYRYPYGRYVYEQHYNVKLQKNEVIWFIDRNPLNCVPENLEKITCAERITRNYNGKKAGEKMRNNWKELKQQLSDCGIELKQRKKIA